jgi:hypothetical protein
MRLIPDMIDDIRQWKLPKEAFHKGEKSPFLLSCSLEGRPALMDDIEKLAVGDDLKEFWKIVGSVDLFKDDAYGQWGLKILHPVEARNLTECEKNDASSGVKASDVVIGEFYGDSDLLIVDSQNSGQDMYSIHVKSPLDDRNEWSQVANSFSEFLARYIQSQGDKYWE